MNGVGFVDAVSKEEAKEKYEYAHSVKVIEVEVEKSVDGEYRY